MRFLSLDAFIQLKTPHISLAVLKKIYPKIIIQKRLFCLIVFGSMSTEYFTSNSDLDLILLYLKEVDNKQIRRQFTTQLLKLSEIRKVDIFAYSKATFKKMVNWNNSIALNAINGIVIYPENNHDIINNFFLTIFDD